MKWSKQLPTVPGWYWCRNGGDKPGEWWEAVVRMDEGEAGLVCSWMTAPGKADTMHQSHFNPSCEWAGPIVPPTTASPAPYVALLVFQKPKGHW